MNKNEAMTEIETIRARLTVLEKIVQEEEKPQGLWRPETGESYHALDWSADAILARHSEHKFDYMAINFGNCFPTREAAEKAAPLFARAHKIIQAALMVDPECGRYEEGGREYSAGYLDGRWASVHVIGDRTSCAPFVHTRAQAEHMAAILNAEGV